MSYNPKRMNPNQAKHVRRQKAQQGAGSTHAKAVRSQGVGTFAPTTQERVLDRNGITSTAMDCEHFKSYYQCVYAGNNLGFGVNSTGHKTVRVAKGVLYVFTAPATKIDSGWEIDNSAKSIEKISEGSFINLPAGTAYGLAASGTVNVELLITESPGYSEGWVECEAGVMRDGELPYQHAAGQIDGRDRVNSQSEREVVSKQSSKRRQRQAQAHSDANRPAPQFNPNSSAVIGVNPQPANMSLLADD